MLLRLDWTCTAPASAAPTVEVPKRPVSWARRPLAPAAISTPAAGSAATPPAALSMVRAR